MLDGQVLGASQVEYKLPLKREVSYLLLVDYDFPRSCMTTWTGLSQHMKVGKGLYRPHTADPARSSCPSLACT